MGIKRHHGGNIRKEDLHEDALDGGVKRNASGTIQFTQAGTSTASATTGSAVVTVTASDRHVADKNKVKITEATAGTLTWTLNRNGSSITKKTGVTNTTTTTITKTFSATENPTWTLTVNPTAGSWNLTTWTASVEDVRS